MSCTCDEKVNVVQYPISANYCRNWTPVMALRELIANALDAVNGVRERVTVEFCGKKKQLTIRDNGGGMDPSHLVIGEGEDKSGQQIGQFREGLKLALLVLARLERWVYVRSGSFEIKRVYMETGSLGVPVMHLDLVNDLQRIEDTEVSLECTENEFIEATQLFQAFHPQLAGKVGYLGMRHELGLEEGMTFVNGLRAMVDKDQLGVYSLTGSGAKLSVNRDRDKLSFSDVSSEMTRALAQSGKMQAFFSHLAEKHQECQNIAENNFTAYYFPDEDTREALRAAFGFPGVDPDRVVYDPGSRDVALSDALDIGGYRVIPTQKNQLLHSLLSSKMPSAEAVLRRKRDRDEAAARARAKKDARKRTIGKFVVVEPESLPVHQRGLLSKVVAIIRQVFGREFSDAEFFLFEDSPDKGDGEQSDGGVWLEEPQLVGISVSLLSQEYHVLLGSVAHELAHRKSGASDCTRSFEYTLSMLLGKALARVHPNPTTVQINPFVNPRSPKRQTAACTFGLPASAALAFVEAMTHHVVAPPATALWKMSSGAKREVEKHRWELGSIDVKPGSKHNTVQAFFWSEQRADGKAVGITQYMTVLITYSRKGEALIRPAVTWYKPHDLDMVNDYTEAWNAVREDLRAQGEQVGEDPRKFGWTEEAI